MKVLVIGSGGREHTLVWKINQSPLVKKIYAAPGNAGIGQLGHCVSISADDSRQLAQFAEKEKIDLTVVGPEGPLADGIVDIFNKKGLTIFGPGKEAARIEGDKAFAKDLMKKYSIPTAGYKTFTDIRQAQDYIADQGVPIVVKASGLAAGKGVMVCLTYKEADEALIRIMTDKEFGGAGETVVIEEFLDGEEASILAITDGDDIKTLISSQDHKRIYDNDQGPNTGGMGAYAPAPVITDEMHTRILNTILRPFVQGLRQEGIKYKGVLYAGLMITPQGPKVVEFNCRLGDPETQVVLPLLKTDFVELMVATCEERLKGINVVNHNEAAICIVLASGGYPGSYEKNKAIYGLEDFNENQNIMVFHAGTTLKGEQVVTNGGRVLGITAKAAGIKKAMEAAYKACHAISFEGVHFRKDIGKRALERREK